MNEYDKLKILPNQLRMFLLCIYKQFYFKYHMCIVFLIKIKQSQLDIRLLILWLSLIFQITFRVYSFLFNFYEENIMVLLYAKEIN